jgi:preprotein translocase subunit SecA
VARLNPPAAAWARRARALELVLQAVEAREFFQSSVHYVVREGKVVIVDEATGRIMPDHEWRDGLHQAVSAKEGVEVVPPRATSAQSTFQDFFLRYKTLGGMTGTAWEARREFLQFYRLAVLRIPTHRPCLRRLSYRAFHTTKAGKIRDIVGETVREHARGRAVLVGTKSIEASEQVSAALAGAGLVHEVLNAVQHEREAEIIARAGREKAVTVATNMAGRGTDIKLEGPVRDRGGLHVILTELHSSVRVDRQLHGRAGRQGDPGTVAEIISLEDDLFAAIPAWVRRLLGALLTTGFAGRPAAAAAWKIAALCQWLGDRRAFRLRRQMVKSNSYFADMISYSGKRH